MRIFFICSSLELGRNGVGDYTRRLGFELAAGGNHIGFCAVNDHGVNDYIDEEAERGDIRCFAARLPAALSWDEREKLLLSILDEFKPDWISVQFVPFGFHPKGLCFRWLRFQRVLSKKYCIHVMFHEIWVEWGMPVRFSSRCLGLIQLIIFKVTHFYRSVSVATTHLDYYRTQLRRLKINAKLLPLFGNIPVVSLNRQKARADLLDSLGVDKNVNWYLAGFFGAVLPTLSLNSFSEWLEAVRKLNSNILILAVGKHDASGARNWQRIKRACDGLATAIYLGELGEAMVSQYLSALDCGLTAYPVELSGKSGAVAAMLDHDLSVIGLGKMRMDEKAQLHVITNRTNDRLSCHEVAQDFISVLKAAAARSNLLKF